MSKKNRKLFGLVFIALFFLVLFIKMNSSVIRIYQYLSSTTIQLANVISSVVISDTNNYRSINNQKELVISSKLSLAAQMKAEDMAKKGYFSHVGPNGERPWFWFEKIGYKYEYAGENLAIDFNESNEVVDAWIDSAKHNANLLNSNFTEIGVGVASGFFEGKNTIFVVQFFGKPFSSNLSKEDLSEKQVLNKIDEIEPNKSVVTREGLSSGEVLGVSKNSWNFRIYKWSFVIFVILFGFILFKIFKKFVLK